LESGELRIRAAGENDRLFELIPHSILQGDFPQHMVDDCAHWMDIKSEEIEFRPLNSQWEPSKHNTRVYYQDLEMRGEGKKFLDVRSNSASMIHSVLQPLEYSQFVEATIKDEDSSLEIKLPRFNLVFFANKEKDLECLQFRDMIMDGNQEFGTMVGLRNRLVLRDKSNKEGSLRRKVLIPHGTVHSRTAGSHVEVIIDTTRDKKVVFHAFDIDPILCRLVGNSSLRSRLYKIYLHALTSHCLTDPLTGRTGTEEALHDLNSAAIWSFRGLDSNERDLLDHIANLTPTRRFYPQHLQVM
jgi:hypothetical protein